MSLYKDASSLQTPASLYKDAGALSNSKCVESREIGKHTKNLDLCPHVLGVSKCLSENIRRDGYRAQTV